MKKNILSMAALLIASAAVFTACSSDDNITSEQPANPTGKYIMTVQASKDGDATTRALTLDETTSPHKLNATWATTENVYVKKGDNWATGSLQPQTAGETATLKGTLSGIEINASDVLTLQFPKDGDISYDGQVGTLEDIAANFDYATATVTVASVSDGNITTAADANFANQQAIVKFTLIDKADGTTSLSASQLVINDGTTDYTINPASETSEIYAAIPGFSGQTVRLTATVGNKTYTYEKASQSFTNGQYYEITVKMTEVLKPDLLSGVFSVNSTKKVKFSKGNLRYASGAWSFFNNQYDYYTSYSEDACDKFGWSTSTTYGKNTSTSKYAYTGNFKDWGATMGAGWFTLSSAEWTYLFNTRTVNGGTGSGKSYTLGQSVNGKLGVVIYPDNYTGEVYSGSDWATFESAGCVFLPAAGYRYGSGVSNAGTYGGYWSATPNNDDKYHAYYVYFNYYSSSLSFSPAENYWRYYGCSIRLVRQVE